MGRARDALLVLVVAVAACGGWGDASTVGELERCADTGASRARCDFGLTCVKLGPYHEMQGCLRTCDRCRAGEICHRGGCWRPCGEGCSSCCDLETDSLCVAPDVCRRFTWRLFDAGAPPVDAGTSDRRGDARDAVDAIRDVPVDAPPEVADAGAGDTGELDGAPDAPVDAPVEGGEGGQDGQDG